VRGPGSHNDGGHNGFHPLLLLLRRVSPAENIPAADASADLILVVEALHWFNLEAFFAEVGRVLRPGGVLAVLG